MRNNTEHVIKINKRNIVQKVIKSLNHFVNRSFQSISFFINKNFVLVLLMPYFFWNVVINKSVLHLNSVTSIQ